VTTQIPPVADGAVRIIVHDPEAGPMKAAFAVADLGDLLDFSGIAGPMPERTLEGSLRAVALYGEAMRRGEDLIAIAVALWICINGGDMPALAGGLNLADLSAAASAGNGTINIYPAPDGRTWEFRLSSNSGVGVNGHVRIDMPAWSKMPMGSA
jgi:hypothetical protein